MPAYRLETVKLTDNKALFNYSIDTSDFSRSTKMAIEFVWSTGDTGLITITKPGKYVCSIKGKLTFNYTYIAKDGDTINEPITVIYCYHGIPDTINRDSIYKNNKWYYSDPLPQYKSFQSGLLDTIVVSHITMPIKYGAKIISQNGKVITFNQWYIRRLQGLE